MGDNLKVLLTTEGTYPFHQGGVSTWCDILVHRLKSVDFVVYSVMMNPFVTQKFDLPDSAELIKLPLWGTEEPSEHLHESFSKSYLSIRRTTAKEIEHQFIPLFKQLIHEIIAPKKNPKHLAEILLKLHLYFENYEYKTSFRSQSAWEAYKSIVLEHVANANDQWPRPDIYCLIQSLGWLYRFLNILNTPIPEVDITHASAAAFCALPCVLAKMKNNTPFILTEHGVYLREQYLGLSKNQYSSFLNKFLVRMIHSITTLGYAYADQISPVCDYNTRWETKFGVNRKNIKVIYNGVDPTIFHESTPQNSGFPTVVTVARIDPLKDIFTLIKSAAIVKARIPNVRFKIYGSIASQTYYTECLELRKQLELEDTVEFVGHLSNIVEAYKSGDIVAVTSISEAFPYSVVEAMLCGKAVISTDVGGINEAVGDTGILVSPRDFDALADGIVELLTNVKKRNELAQDARERALAQFTIEKVLKQYLDSYLGLAGKLPAMEPIRTAIASLAERRAKQRNLAERAYAFLTNGLYIDAVRHFKLAVMIDPNLPAVPVLLVETAEAYNQMGMFDQAFLELEKYYALVTPLESA